MKTARELFFTTVNSSCALVHPGAAVIHEACSKFNTSQFQAERGNFQTSLSNVLKERFTKMHADVTDLQVKCSHGLCVETGQFHSQGVIYVRFGGGGVKGGQCQCGHPLREYIYTYIWNSVRLRCFHIFTKWWYLCRHSWSEILKTVKLCLL